MSILSRDHKILNSTSIIGFFGMWSPFFFLSFFTIHTHPFITRKKIAVCVLFFSNSKVKDFSVSTWLISQLAFQGSPENESMGFSLVQAGSATWARWMFVLTPNHSRDRIAWYVNYFWFSGLDQGGGSWFWYEINDLHEGINFSKLFPSLSIQSSHGTLKHYIIQRI